MEPCFGPYGGVCAFLAAVGGILTLSGSLLALLDQSANNKKGYVTPFIKVILVGGVLLIATVVLSTINDSRLPPQCSRQGQTSVYQPQ